MGNFVKTGVDEATQTDVDSGLLTLTETNNGRDWFIEIECGGVAIETIHLDDTVFDRVDPDVKRLPVYDIDGAYLGTLVERLVVAYNVGKQ